MNPGTKFCCNWSTNNEDNRGGGGGGGGKPKDVKKKAWSD